MRLGKHDGASDAGWFACRILKSVKQTADDCQAMAAAGADAKSLKPGYIEQDARCATAVVEVGDQVQAIHRAILLRFT